MTDERSIDPAVCDMLEMCEDEGIVTAFDRADQLKPCPIGNKGACCKNCSMGPCRLTKDGQVGVCGATIDTVAARNFARMTAAGASAHSDHGRDMALTLFAAAVGEAPDYAVRDVRKLHEVAELLGVDVQGRDAPAIAKDVAERALQDFGRQSGLMPYVKRAPKKRQEIWREQSITPRGIDREVVDIMHRTHVGNDQSYGSLLMSSLRTALADGWGGSMLSTDSTDILFGSPVPVLAKANMGNLKKDEVNVVIHGHEPTLSEMILVAVNDPDMISYAKSKGAKGINLTGICCTANETLMRQGVATIGNFLSQELAIATGAVDMMVVDIQCITSSTKIVFTRTDLRIPCLPTHAIKAALFSHTQIMHYIIAFKVSREHRIIFAQDMCTTCCSPSI